jgi:hypothetical protein
MGDLREAMHEAVKASWADTNGSLDDIADAILALPEMVAVLDAATQRDGLTREAVHWCGELVDAEAQLAIGWFTDGEIAAQDVLTALHAAGRLLPPGGETHVEDNVEFKPVGQIRGGVTERTYVNRSTDELAREFEAALELGARVVSHRRRSVTTWSDGSTHTSAWEATDA